MRMIEKQDIYAGLFPPTGLYIPLKYVPMWPAIDKAIDNLVAAMNGEECDCGCKCVPPGRIWRNPKGKIVSIGESEPESNRLAHDVCQKRTEDIKSLPEEELLIIEALTGEPERPPGITATDAPKKSPPPSKIPHTEDERIYKMRDVDGKGFVAIAKSLNGRGISCSGSDVSNRYYEIRQKCRDGTALSIEDARILTMANEGAMVHEICVYVSRNFHHNYSTSDMTEKIRKLQAGKKA